MLAFAAMIVDTGAAMWALLPIARFKIAVILPAHLELAGRVENSFGSSAG